MVESFKSILFSIESPSNYFGGIGMTEGQNKTMLRLVSDEMGIFGPTLKTSIEALPTNDGRYLVSLDEWNATLGPIYDRSVEKIHSSRNDRSYMAVAFGYQAMDPSETQSYHTLVQAFNAADALKAGRDVFDKYLDTFRTGNNGALNSYGEQLKEFAETLVHEGQVLITREQLQGLTDIARRGMEYVAEHDAGAPSEDFFDKNVRYNPRMDYSNGLINLIL